MRLRVLDFVSTMVTSVRARGCWAVQLPHIIDTTDMGPKELLVFIPGPVAADDVEDVSRILSLCASKPGWKVVVGWCTPYEEKTLTQVAASEAVDISFTGYLAEEELLRQFARSAVVVRPYASRSPENRHAASGPLSWAAGQACVVVTDDDRSGAIELERAGLVIRSADLVGSLNRVIDSYSPLSAARIRQTARESMGCDAVASTYFDAARRSGSWRSGDGPDRASAARTSLSTDSSQP